MDERLKLANDWVDWLKDANISRCPYAVDLMDNEANVIYQAFPERLYVIEDGIVKFFSKPGPWSYNVGEVKSWLEARLA